MSQCVTCGREHEPRQWPKVVTEEMRILWREGKADFPVPPVPTGLWEEVDWCRWVEMHGRWTGRVKFRFTSRDDNGRIYDALGGEVGPDHSAFIMSAPKDGSPVAFKIPPGGSTTYVSGKQEYSVTRVRDDVA